MVLRGDFRGVEELKVHHGVVVLMVSTRQEAVVAEGEVVETGIPRLIYLQTVKLELRLVGGTGVTFPIICVQHQDHPIVNHLLVNGL